MKLFYSLLVGGITRGYQNSFDVINRDSKFASEQPQRAGVDDQATLFAIRWPFYCLAINIALRCNIKWVN